MKPRLDLFRVVACTLIAGLAGFCYSIVSQADSGAATRDIGGSGASPRAVGSSALRFTNALSLTSPPDYDLGDGFYGSIMTRYITVTGGIRPYVYISPNISTVRGNFSSLDVMQSGCVMGTISPTTLIQDLVFTVIAADSTELQAKSKSQQQTNISPAGRFHLTLSSGGAQTFRFGTDRINDGLLGQSYAAKIEALGGKGSVEYSIVAGTVSLNGAPFGTGSSLEAFGFTLAQDGTLLGRALKAGTISFVARAKDSLGRTAKGRTVTTDDQLHSFTIADTQTTSTDSAVLSIKVKGNTAKLGGDSIAFACKFNFNNAGFGTINLANKRFTFILGANVYTGFLSATGKIINAGGGKLVFADGSYMSGQVDGASGVIKGTISKANLSARLDAVNLADRSLKRLPVGFFFCDFVISSNLVDFAAKHAGTKFSLDYVLGKTGTALGGNFQLLNLRAKDGFDIAGNPGTAWKVDFVAQPRTGVDDNAAFNNLADPAIGIRINQGFTQLIKRSEIGTDSKGSLVFKSTLQTGVKSLKIKAGVFTGSIETFTISAAQTTIPQAIDKVADVDQTFFNLGIDVNRNAPDASWHGEGARSIIKELTTFDPAAPRAHNKWIDRVQKRPH